MLLGEYKHSVDQKGRLAIPAKFRPQLSSGAIITRGLDHSLFLFDLNEWEILAKKLMALPLAQADSRAFVRLMLSGASHVEIDNQGRILIPDTLRNYSSIEKMAVVTGLYNRIEIWSEDIWKKYKANTEDKSDEIAEKLSQLGI